MPKVLTAHLHFGPALLESPSHGGSVQLLSSVSFPHLLSPSPFSAHMRRQPNTAAALFPAELAPSSQSGKSHFKVNLKFRSCSLSSQSQKIKNKNKEHPSSLHCWQPCWALLFQGPSTVVPPRPGAPGEDGGEKDGEKESGFIWWARKAVTGSRGVLGCCRWVESGASWITGWTQPWNPPPCYPPPEVPHRLGGTCSLPALNT